MLKFKDFLSKKRFVFVGDIMQHPEQLRFEHETGFKYECFDEVMHLWSDADYVFGNLETTLAGFTEPPKDRAAEFVAPDEFIIALKRVGFTHLSLCNNHMYDKGVAGFKRTIEKVREAGIVPVYGKVKVDDFEVMNFTTHLNKEEDDEFMKIPPHDEKTIAIPHWGGQYVPVNEDQLETEKNLKSNVIIGSGPHCTQEVKCDGSRIVAYSLGDFLSAHQKPGSTDVGRVIVLDIFSSGRLEFKSYDTFTETVNGKSTIKVKS